MQQERTKSKYMQYKNIVKYKYAIQIAHMWHM